MRSPVVFLILLLLVGCGQCTYIFVNLRLKLVQKGNIEKFDNEVKLAQAALSKFRANKQDKALQQEARKGWARSLRVFYVLLAGEEYVYGTTDKEELKKLIHILESKEEEDLLSNLDRVTEYKELAKPFLTETQVHMDKGLNELSRNASGLEGMMARVSFQELLSNYQTLLQPYPGDNMYFETDLPILPPPIASSVPEASILADALPLQQLLAQYKDRVTTQLDEILVLFGPDFPSWTPSEDDPRRLDNVIIGHTKLLKLLYTQELAIAILFMDDKYTHILEMLAPEACSQIIQILESHDFEDSQVRSFMTSLRDTVLSAMEDCQSTLKNIEDMQVPELLSVEQLITDDGALPVYDELVYKNAMPRSANSEHERLSATAVEVDLLSKLLTNRTITANMVLVVMAVFLTTLAVVYLVYTMIIRKKKSGDDVIV
jgi:hypothetical protein